MSYDESWGGVLGPATHWRCKLCADGVGESADVVAADLWRVDERGYPVFTEGPGSSALIARTERGLEAVRAAAAAGALVLRPIRDVRRSRRRNRCSGTVGSRSSAACSEAGSPGFPDLAIGASDCGPWRWRILD